MSNDIGIYYSSSKYEDDAISLKKQENMLMKYKNKEYPFDEFRLYVDKDKNPEYNNQSFNKLINDIKNKEINLVLITSLDRITYKIADMGTLLQFFEKENCNIITVSDNVDFKSEIGVAKKQCILQLSSWYSKSKKEESNRGLVEKVEKGQYPIGNTPLGYRKVKNYLKIDSCKSNALIDIFDLSCDGFSIEDIIVELKIKHYISLTYNAIKAILQNTIYIGNFTYKGKIYNNIAPPLIEKSKFDRAYKLISLKERNGDDSYYFKRKIRCACGEFCTCTSHQSHQQ